MAQKLGLSNNQLKMIAMLTMLCDHVALTFFPSSLLLRILGRISFPIFAYMIAEGCRYTKCRWKHFAMLFGLGAICQVVFLVAMNSWYMGILLTFSLSILTIYAIDYYLSDRTNRRLGMMIAALCGVVLVSVLLPGLLFEYGFTFDYGPFGVFFAGGNLLCAPQMAQDACYACRTHRVGDCVGWRAMVCAPGTPVPSALQRGARTDADEISVLHFLSHPSCAHLSHLLAYFVKECYVKLHFYPRKFAVPNSSAR